MDTELDVNAELNVNEELTVGDLERLLFAAFPATDAIPGDRVGLLVGDVQAPVGLIAIALDASIDAVEVAAAYGCNVLVTHHPVFWEPPTLFLREMGTQSSNGAAIAAAAAVYRAAEKGVSLIAMHTNLDSAPAAAGMLLDPVGYEFDSIIAPIGQACSGLGQIGVPRKSGSTSDGANSSTSTHLTNRNTAAQPATLKELAQRYEEAFGAVAKVWGDEDTVIEVLATCSGGAGELVGHVIASKADCFATGELRYHEALELAAAGVALIELGHDRSELPYRYYLRDALLAAGISKDSIHVIEPLVSWWQPWRAEQ